jgi:predicted PurR-regulated permease PerM
LGTVLLIWSVPVLALDNVLRPILIRRGVKLPLLLIIGGVIGGLVGFGVVGLFVGSSRCSSALASGSAASPIPAF